MTSSSPSPRRRFRIAAAIVVPIVLVVVGYSAYGFYRVWKMNQDVLPTFTDPPDGARAPTSNAFGAVVGVSSFDDVNALIASWKLECRDTSMRALMGAQRDLKKAEIAAAKERGDDVDGISGASLVDYRSPKERNPQLRLSCEKTSHTALKDRERQPSTGRALFILDSPTLPLRHASYRRQHVNHPAARDDFADTVNHYVGIFGAPHVKSELPPVNDDGSVKFPDVTPHKFQWSFADLHIRVEAMSFGKRGVDVNEVVEVPWPVRASAPQDPR